MNRDNVLYVSGIAGLFLILLSGFSVINQIYAIVGFCIAMVSFFILLLPLINQVKS